jgi:plasmid stabilization system protein ParE
VDYRLVYTKKALNDLAEIVVHIAEDDAQAASRFGEALVATLNY